MVSIENDYCAFMVSTMIELSRTTDFTGAPQFTPEAIAMKLSEDIKFFFDSVRCSLETSSENDVDDTEVVEMTHELIQETGLSNVSKRSIEQLNACRDTIS
jgi:hypothetical protein